MPRIHTATTGLVGKVNRTVILELLRERGVMSRVEIAEASGLSPATVNRLVSRLTREHLIVFDSHAPSTGGRPPRLVRYNARIESVIVIDVGATETRGAVADLDGVFLSRESQRTNADDVGAGGGQSVHDLLALVDHLMADAIERRLRPRGIAIGVPSVVKPGGIVEWAPALGWREMALGDLVRSRAGLPTFIENDVNLLALGEHRRGAGVGTHTMVALAIEAGLGGALIIEDQLYRGANSAAGEVGYMLTGRESLDHLYPGFGDLEGRIAGFALAQRAADIGVRGSSRAAMVLGVFTAANNGDAQAAAIVDDVIDLLALTAGNISSLLDPELIVIGGSVVESVESIIEGVSQRLVGRVPHPPRIEPSLLGGDAVLAGAAALAIERTADYAFVRAPDRTTQSMLATSGRAWPLRRGSVNSGA
jgi:predicted NBD/HSP70 family sugar kinase